MIRTSLKRWLSSAMVLCIVFSLAFSFAPAGFASAQPVQPTTAQTTVDYDQLPPILITEIVPDSSNVNGADGYEFVEIYNNTDKAMNYKDYKLVYRYPNGLEFDQVWATIPEEVMIEPGGTLVLWITNNANQQTTVADFNANYGTNLVENKDIVRTEVVGGMHNSRERTMIIATNTGYELVEASYNVGVKDTAPDKGIFYKYPEDGSTTMRLISSATDPATPGSVSPDQIPAEPVKLKPDTVPPVIENLTDQTGIGDGQDLQIVANAQDDVMVHTFTLHYRSAEQSEYTSVNLKISREDSLFHHTIDFLEFLGSKYVEYYFTAFDGTNETVSELYKIDIVQDLPSPRLNWKDGDILTGRSTILAAADGIAPDELQLFVDGSEVNETYRALDRNAYFAFEVDGMDEGYKNSVSLGNEVIRLIDVKITGFDTVIVPVDPVKLHQNNNTVTLRAGSTKSIIEENPQENLDDFDVRNVRLLLSDGTVVRDPQYSDPEEILDMGDNGRYLPVVDFTFPIPQDKLTSKAYLWDTTTAAEGNHLIRVLAPGQGEAAAHIQVDNSAPFIQTTVEEGKLYKGPFTIDVTVTDEIAGVGSVEILLDGQPIEVPFAASSAGLEPGEHLLQISALDKIGLKSEKSVLFSTVEENPHPPELVSPQDGAANVELNPTLSVKVSDPTEDELDVTFYRGYKYNASQTDRVQVYKNATDMEPPRSAAPDGEEALTEAELANLASVDQQYVTLDSTTQFPYLRFEVELDGNITQQDTVEVVWKGNTLANRKVTMYAWNYSEDRWKAIDSFVAKTEEDFTLTGIVDVPDYVREQKVNVIVQDQIPTPDEYDYTFVWMTDTQFYTEVFPHIYESQVNWIVEQAEEMKIDYVIHTGDIVNVPDYEAQWLLADRYMGVLDQADIPYGVLAGNHDVKDLGNNEFDYTNYYRYFGADRFQDRPYYGESYKNNRGHYDLISSHGNDYIIVYMGWGIGDEEIAWLNQVLADHPDRKAILCFHDYLMANGNRAEIGDILFDRVVVPNENVVLVLNGHRTGSTLRTDEIDDNGDGIADRKVYQILTDYQGHGEGGDGFMKLFHFDTATDTIYVNTYSPYKEKYNYYDPAEFPGKDEFTLSLSLEPQVKRVATDYFEVNLYTNTEIGSVQGVPSGQTVEAQWNGLTSGQTYQWYTRVTDDFGGRTVSDIWSFTTGAGLELPAPSHLRVTGTTDTTIGLTWNPVADPNGRNIQYELYKDGQRHAAVTEAVYTVTGLAPDTEYRFYVVAADDHGYKSAPSETIIAATSASEPAADLDAIRQLVDGYIASDDLRGPLAKQLSNTLSQAQHQYDKGRLEQAARDLDKFLKQLNNQAMQRHISAEAKEQLEQQVSALLQHWREQ
ncbi:fibronectin type III domain-containing protein [Paenibacillus sp. J2TS4]|uniref:FIMAH domain-containing protein n=1 Tax=Paenibacillus sp. J2TS4 TaxID=2807194 RepID=UPI001B2E971A|nr:lamin tail domain-containing protein [Paenibacillus sp. J2TS4]GIP33363.1 hypothetical protein J2TS4_25730 [Paenibacillus sp. J2TS4]